MKGWEIEILSNREYNQFIITYLNIDGIIDPITYNWYWGKKKRIIPFIDRLSRQRGKYWWKNGRLKY